MNDSLELQSLNNNPDKTQAPSGNGGCRTDTAVTVAEVEPLFNSTETVVSDPDPSNENPTLPQTERFVDRVKRELMKNYEVGNKKVKLWKILLFIIILLVAIVFVIVISITLSIVLYQDPDDKYDVRSFVEPRVFSGSVRVANQNFSRNTTALHGLATQLGVKLNTLYRSSHALARYFKYARIKTLSEGSVIIDFCLEFGMPRDSDQLVRYTLSREMVSAVLRQHLYDQAGSDGNPLYIPPTNASMQVGGSSCSS